ncbi:TetR/AcrR family transcriptional regulator [Methylobacterium sp. C25]|uniref:TetR/AcrR family transcriptional regulator n=1 Tax=Methylobacterium sp. C25 TaxID=2721622 RepID=UPI001F2DCDE8|nr:TetR/AcrR family transcriptional regulator [Methylobacterium sp. C25]MCE4226616.1 TetR/AcrR family transcriptional regulator [Methylobacterium sp. C25]
MSEPQKRGRGRPPKLDRQAALRDAMTLFWENGYEGTTFDDLIGKMSISPSSFYNAFGSKERLYREATECFVEGSRKWIFDSLFQEGVTARTAFSNLFEAVATQFTNPDMPRGCMVSLSGTHQGSSLTSLREMMVDIRAGTETYFAERIRKGISEGDVPADVDVDGHAAFLNTLLRGLAVQARDGASREKLARIAKAGLDGMPGRLSA